MKFPAFLVNLFLKKEDLKELKPLFRKVKSYRLMVFEDHHQSLQKEFAQFVKQYDYKPLMKIKNHNDNVAIYTLEQKHRIREIVMNVKDKQSIVMIGLKTNLSYEELSDLLNADAEK